MKTRRNKKTKRTRTRRRTRRTRRGGSNQKAKPEAKPETSFLSNPFTSAYSAAGSAVEGLTSSVGSLGSAVGFGSTPKGTPLNSKVVTQVNADAAVDSTTSAVGSLGSAVGVGSTPKGTPINSRDSSSKTLMNIDTNELAKKTGIKDGNLDILKIALSKAKQMMYENNLVSCEQRAASREQLEYISVQLNGLNRGIDTEALDNFAKIMQNTNQNITPGTTLRSVISTVYTNIDGRTGDDNDCNTVLRGISVLLKHIESKLPESPTQGQSNTNKVAAWKKYNTNKDAFNRQMTNYTDKKIKYNRSIGKSFGLRGRPPIKPTSPIEPVFDRPGTVV